MKGLLLEEKKVKRTSGDFHKGSTGLDIKKNKKLQKGTLEYWGLHPLIRIINGNHH